MAACVTRASLANARAASSTPLYSMRTEPSSDSMTNTRFPRGLGSLARLDDAHDALVVQSQIVRQPALFLPREHPHQVLVRQKRAMLIMRVQRLSREASVEVGHELVQVRVANLAVGDAPQTQFLHEPILQRLVRTLDATLGGG